MATSEITNLTNVKELSDGSPAGTRLGQSATDLVAFHGASPVAQQSITTVATGGTAGDAVAAIQSIVAALRTKGIFAT